MAPNQWLCAVGGLALASVLSACGGGGSSSAPSTGAIAGTPTPSPSPSTATATLPAGANTSFTNITAAMGLGHDFGFSAGLNPMVVQFAGGAATGDIDADGDVDAILSATERSDAF